MACLSRSLLKISAKTVLSLVHHTGIVLYDKCLETPKTLLLFEII